MKQDHQGAFSSSANQAKKLSFHGFQRAAELQSREKDLSAGEI